MRSGYFVLVNSYLWVPGIDGFDWSDMASSRHSNGFVIPSSYSLSFDAADAYPSNGPSARWYGYPLRGLGGGGGAEEGLNMV